MNSPAEIVIYQPGKVGSSAIAFALERAGFSVAHVHMLNEKRLRALASRCAERGEEAPPYIEEAFRIRKDYIEPGRRMIVVCAVRDPVARNLSAFFENIEIFCPDWRRLKKRDLPSVAACFFETYPHHVATEWFDLEFRDVLDIDVYASPFSHDEGYGRYSSSSAEALVLRAEDSNEKKQRALTAFLNVENINLRNENKSARRPWGDVYGKIKKQIVFPDAYLDEMYGSKMAKYFYTDNERAAFRENLAPAGMERSTL